MYAGFLFGSIVARDLSYFATINEASERYEEICLWKRRE
jgi:hypothetical protein